MNERNDEPFANTRDLRAESSGPEGEADTRTLNIGESAIRTIEMSDAERDRQFVGKRPTSGDQGTLGGYRILRKIGQGGMGIVFEAEQQQPKRLVALKVILGGLYASEYHKRMFEREVHALARLKHPGIVSIYEAGRFDDGQVFYAMELLFGDPLTEFAAKRENSSIGPLSTDEKLRLFEQLCSVVAYAHQRGVIHRDLKPQNVFVTDEAGTNSLSDSGLEKIRVKVLDFGLARITDPDMAGATDVSQVGHIKGTLNYMSPEQLSGNPADIDVRSDVYSLGVMLYELLTGRLPYDIRKLPMQEAIKAIAERPPDPMRGSVSGTQTTGRRGTLRFDRDIETIVLKALEKEPERRYQSVAAMMDDILRYRSNQPILARPPSTAYQVSKLVARHKAAFAGLASIFLMLLAFGIVMAAQNTLIGQERDRAVRAEQLAQEQRAEAELARQSEQKQRAAAEQNLARAEEQQRAAEYANESEREQRKIAEQNLRRAREEQKRAETQTALAEQQGRIAAEQRTLAEQRRSEAEAQRALVEQREESNRKLTYSSAMILAQEAWEIGDIERVHRLLGSQVPEKGQRDLRGFEWHHLWNISNNELWKKDHVMSAEYSPDDRYVAVNSFPPDNDSFRMLDPAVSILDSTDGREIAVFRGRRSYGFLPDGRLLTMPVNYFDPKFIQKLETRVDALEIVELLKQNDEVGLTRLMSKIDKIFSEHSGFKTALELLDARTGAVEPVSLMFNPSLTLRLFPSPDGRFVAETTGSSVKVWSITTGAQVASFEGAEQWFDFGGFSADGRFVAINGSKTNEPNKRAVVWDLKAGKEYSSIEGERGALGQVTLSPNGKFLAATNFDESLTYYDVDRQKKPLKREMGELRKRFGGGIEGIVISPNNLLTVVLGGRAAHLNSPCGDAFIRGHSKFILSASFSRNSKKLATVGSDGSLKVWNVACEGNLDRIGFDPDVSPDGKMLAASSFDSIELWEIATGKPIEKIVEKADDHSSVSSPKYSPDGRYLAVTRRQRSGARPDPDQEISSVLEIWEVGSKKRITTFTKGISSRFAFSPDSRVLAVVNRKGQSNIQDYEVDLWEFGTFSRIGSAGNGFSAAFHPDGKTLAVASGGKVKLFDISDIGEKKEIGSFFRVSTLSDTPVVFSPDGSLLATIVENDVLIWDFTRRTEVARLTGHAAYVASVAFSPDAARIVTTSWGDGTVRIWDSSTWQQVLSTSLESARSANFVLDGRALIVEGGSGTQIWRTDRAKTVPDN